MSYIIMCNSRNKVLKDIYTIRIKLYYKKILTKYIYTLPVIIIMPKLDCFIIKLDLN